MNQMKNWAKTLEYKVLKENSLSLKLLIVNSDNFIHEVFEDTFSKLFKEIDYASTIKNAYELFFNNHYDLIIVHSNVLNQKNICSSIKSIAPKKHLIVVADKMLTKDIISLSNIGVSGFIETPFESEKILRLLLRVTNEIIDFKAIYTLNDSYLYETVLEQKMLQKNSQNNSYLQENTLEQTKLEEISESVNKPIGHFDQLFKEFTPISSAALMRTRGMKTLGASLCSLAQEIDMLMSKLISNPSQHNVEQVSQHFKRFSDISKEFNEFYNITAATEILSRAFEDDLDEIADENSEIETVHSFVSKSNSS